jgi:hypothetical protein
MELVKRADVPQVELRTERVTVEALGGDVLVRGRTLAHALRLANLRARAVLPQDGETEDDAQARAGAEIGAATLALQVLDGDEQPLMPADKWGIWGASHGNDFERLYAACERVSGADEEAVAKN